MVRRNNFSKLHKYAQRTQSKLEFEVISEGPENKHVTFKVVLNGQDFFGVGSTPRTAKENAAKKALRSLSEKENQGIRTKNAPKNPDVAVYQENRSKAKSGQKNRLQMKSAAGRVDPNISTLLSRLEIGDNKGATVAGKIKRRLVFDDTSAAKNNEVPSAAVLSNNGLSKLLTSQTPLDPSDVSSESVAKTPDLSNHSIVQDGNSPEEINRSETPSARSQNIWSKTEFVCIEELGKGAGGRVFKATHLDLKMDFAVKMVPWKEEALREAEALASLHHENIVQFYNCWSGESGPQLESSGNSWSTSPSSVSSSASWLFIQMELCDISTLRDWIDGRNTNEFDIDSQRRRQSLSFMLDIISGVEYLHSKRFIHRDLKPTNIMFGLDGKVKIGDFGLVAFKDADQLERSPNKGTESYMAPEQKSELTYNGKVDIFSLGLINFELVWKISTNHERGLMWGNVRAQKLPQEFIHSYWEEFQIIKPMLSEKPEDRPGASQVKAHLEEHTHRLDILEIRTRGSRSV